MSVTPVKLLGYRRMIGSVHRLNLEIRD
jgi:hypothetical protein